MKHREEIITRHNNVVATIQRQLSAAGFHPLRAIVHADTETAHADEFEFWCKDARLLLTHRRKPGPHTHSPNPLFDLYIPLDTSNDMEQTRLAIERYAQPQPARPLASWLQFAGELDVALETWRRQDDELSQARMGLDAEDRDAAREREEDQRINDKRARLIETMFRKYFPQS